MPPPARSSPEIPLLGVQSGKAITPLDLGRFQSKVFHSVLDEMKPKEDVSTPKQNQQGGRRNPLQKEASQQLDTPSRFLSRDQLFRPSFNVKVVTHSVVTECNARIMIAINVHLDLIDNLWTVSYI